MAQKNDITSAENSYKGSGTPRILLILSEKFCEMKKPGTARALEFWSNAD